MVLSDHGFLKSLKNTLVLGFSTMAIAIVAYGLLAYVIARTQYVLRWAFDLVTWLPFMVPGIVLESRLYVLCAAQFIYPIRLWHEASSSC